jgi:hypothetical protein
MKYKIGDKILPSDFDKEQYWEYTIKLINVKEYRDYWENNYGKKWKWN